MSAQVNSGISDTFNDDHHDGPSPTDLRTEYLMCRRSILGHAWDPYVDGQRSSGMGRVFSVRCTRCTTRRHYVLGYRGERISTQYEYPEDYRLSGQVSAEELWTEVFVRTDDGRLVVKAKRIRGTNVSVAVKAQPKPTTNGKTNGKAANGKAANGKAPGRRKTLVSV